ncbi:thioesterase domain-containing protein [Streptomyces sp. PmtA]|uniref:thioesterase II family protein n=1 Tax=Streptomyces sp. PmtA TaxID=3074275 RepID=UPI003014F0EA
MSPADRWLRRHPVRGAVRTRLVCLPHAGGTAGSFAGWAGLLPAGTELIAVQYPGRQDRIAEEPVREMAGMADLLAEALRPLLDRPMLLFGHSMGTGLAYEVAGRLERTDGFVMDHVFVSARPAPHRIDGEHRHRLTDDELVAAMRRLGGPDAAVYDHTALLPLILPPLRADLALLDRYLPGAARTATGAADGAGRRGRRHLPGRGTSRLGRGHHRVHAGAALPRRAPLSAGMRGGSGVRGVGGTVTCRHRATAVKRPAKRPAKGPAKGSSRALPEPCRTVR